MRWSRVTGALATGIVALLASTTTGTAQTASTAPMLGTNGKPLEFDAVSIREDKAGFFPGNISPFGATPDGYRLKDLSVAFVILTAYIPSQEGDSAVFSAKEVVGLPDWVTATRYDIDARVSEADMPRWKDPTLQPAMLRAMLQAMLADRFKLVAHREMKEQPIFALTVDKGGPKFKPSPTTALDDIQQKQPRASVGLGGAIGAITSTNGQTMLFGVTMPNLCWRLSEMAHSHVEDKTGLTGKYDITYQFDPPPPGQGGPGDPQLQIPTVMHQLGLKLMPAKGQVETLVIDHIERPSQN